MCVCCSFFCLTCLCYILFCISDSIYPSLLQSMFLTFCPLVRKGVHHLCTVSVRMPLCLCIRTPIYQHIYRLPPCPFIRSLDHWRPRFISPSQSFIHIHSMHLPLTLYLSSTYSILICPSFVHLHVHSCIQSSSIFIYACLYHVFVQSICQSLIPGNSFIHPLVHSFMNLAGLFSPCLTCACKFMQSPRPMCSVPPQASPQGSVPNAHRLASARRKS